MSQNPSRATVRLFGVPASVTYRLDATEVERRRSAGLGSLARLDLLDVLMGLPVGLPVQRACLTEREQRLLRELPDGVVTEHDDQLVRRAVQPLTVHNAVVAARGWRTGLRKAGRFAPFCARSVRLPQLPDDFEEVSVQAGFYGIGVLIGPPCRAEQLVAAQPYARHRHGPGHWWFAEEVFGQLGAVVEEGALV